MLDRKHEGARSRHEHGVFACFRYNDLKVAAGDCGGCGLMAGPGLTAMGIESFSIYNLLILQGLGKSKKNETAVKSIILRHDVRSIAREASAAPAASFKSACGK